MMKPIIISSSDSHGGAARAAARLHNCLNLKNIPSKMLVTSKQSDDYRVKGIKSKFTKTKYELFSIMEKFIAKAQNTSNHILHSPARFGILKAKHIKASNAEVVNLHWVCGSCLSIEEIPRIKKPLIWTLHDMWSFCGAEHVSPDTKSTRWREGYTKENRDINHGGFDLDRWVWKRKRAAWTKPFHIVVPSEWLAKCVKESALMQGWPVTVIPNVLDTELYKPIEKNIARQILGLPLNFDLVLFGAMGGTNDHNKGWDLLYKSLLQLSSEKTMIHGVIFGQSQPKEQPQLDMPLSWMGHINDDYTLALLYSAADVMVVPSRVEAFGQTASEAQACGCPVVAFDTSGLKDVINHKKTGYLAKPYSAKDLSAGIKWVLESTSRYMSLSQAARKRAVELCSPEVVVPQYLDVYKKAIESHHSSKKKT